ncbi:hypothetical protein [Paenibacillus pabuli]|uniref:hypothetical protein n=2 Tax=Paenibacillus TaxID=44249 RepID=UPI00117F0C89
MVVKSFGMMYSENQLSRVEIELRAAEMSGVYSRVQRVVTGATEAGQLIRGTSSYGIIRNRMKECKRV